LNVPENINIFLLPQKKDTRFTPISPYPFVLRDIAVWTVDASENDVREIISNNAGKLLVCCQLFDRFEKDKKVSYAFSLVFQSQDRTLTDNEINDIMNTITSTLNSKDNWEVR
jgi:phenylalanyl-tRNA synthetase beta subunit